tara:strand:+ start:183 stop:857 length:675 start_codon:yes stop_codon:yes gene_type:complete
MNITLLVGANATGKSTRLKTLIDLLSTNLGAEGVDYEYTFFDTKKDKVRTVVIGRLFPNGFLILGSEAKNHAGWVCLDKAVLSTQDMRTDFYKYVMANDSANVKHIVAEGYFNCTSPKMRPEYLRETGFDLINCIFMYYDTVEEFYTRTKLRSNHDRDMAWAEGCAGWKDNSSFRRSHEKSLEQDRDIRQRAIRMNIHAPRETLYEIAVGTNPFDSMEGITSFN